MWFFFPQSPFQEHTITNREGCRGRTAMTSYCLINCTSDSTEIISYTFPSDLTHARWGVTGSLPPPALCATINMTAVPSHPEGPCLFVAATPPLKLSTC
ncbi:hypothetical protein CDAR_180421 [Caerostris darwini]|uniref:Uncharacterized protein n=1 Tax=Caerostris darwini TaxID=1538125 RepID=A0AAV4NSG2_9ARAC|nr:hypothetical protein CDAR_180421 [Caerostris darwini]